MARYLVTLAPGNAGTFFYCAGVIHDSDVDAFIFDGTLEELEEITPSETDDGWGGWSAVQIDSSIRFTNYDADVMSEAITLLRKYAPPEVVKNFTDFHV